MAEKKETAVQKANSQPTNGETVTTPPTREHADETTFAKDFLCHLNADSTKLPDYVHEANKVDVVKTALERGLRATSEVTIASSKNVDKNNVLVAYSVSVVPNDVKHVK